MSESEFAYIGRVRDCGCVVTILCDNLPDRADFCAEELFRLAIEGYVIERVPIERIRSKEITFAACPHGERAGEREEWRVGFFFHEDDPLECVRTVAAFSAEHAAAIYVEEEEGIIEEWEDRTDWERPTDDHADEIVVQVTSKTQTATITVTRHWASGFTTRVDHIVGAEQLILDL